MICELLALYSFGANKPRRKDVCPQLGFTHEIQYPYSAACREPRDSSSDMRAVSMACWGHQRRQKTAANRNPPGDGVVQIGACGGWRHTEELVVRCNVWIRRQPPQESGPRIPWERRRVGRSRGEKSNVERTRSLGDALVYGEAGFCTPYGVCARYGAGMESDNYALHTPNMPPNLTFTTDIGCLY